MVVMVPALSPAKAWSRGPYLKKVWGLEINLEVAAAGASLPAALTLLAAAMVMDRQLNPGRGLTHATLL